MIYTNLLDFFSFFISIVLFMYIRFNAIKENSRIGSDIYYFLLCAESFKKNKSLPIKLPNYYTMEYRNQYYPPLFAIFLSFFSKSFLEKNHKFFNQILDLINILIVLVFIKYLTNFDLFQLSLILFLYSFQGSLINAFYSLTSRSLGLLIYNIIIFSIFVFLTEDLISFYILSIFFICVLILSHKLSVQLLIFQVITFFILSQDFEILILIPLSYLLCFLINSKLTYGIIRHHIEIISFWNKNHDNLGANPLESFYSNESVDHYYKKYNLRNLVSVFNSFIRHNPLLISIFFYYYSYNTFTILQQFLFFIVFSSTIFAVSTYIFRPLKCLGEGHKYLKFSLLPCIILTVFQLTNFENIDFLQQLICVFSLMLLIFYFVIERINRPKQDMSDKFFEFILELKKNKKIDLTKKVLCFPYSLVDQFVFYTRMKVLWGSHGLGFKLIENIVPILKYPLEKITKRYDVRYLIIKDNYFNFRLTNHKVILRKNDFSFIEINKETVFNHYKSNKISNLIKKKIFYVIGSLNIGGTEKHLLSLVNNLNKKLYKIEIFFLSQAGTLKRHLNKEITVYEPRSQTKSKLEIIFILFKLIYYLKKSNPDIFHCFLPTSYILGGAAVRILGFENKLIMSRRSLNNYQKKFRIPIRKIESYFHKFSRLILTNSEVVKKQVIQEGADKNKIKVIYNGITAEKRKLNKTQISDFKSDLNINKGHFIFSCIANFIPYKNHLLIIKASEILLKYNNNFKILFIGGGDDLKYVNILKTEVTKRNLCKNILFIPQQSENIYKFFQISDVGISSSTEEGFSNSIIEFLFYGVPVIATNVGGNAEAIKSNCGILIKNNNVNELFNAMLYFLSEKKLYKFKKNAKEVSKRFSLKKMLSLYEKTYNEFIENNK